MKNVRSVTHGIQVCVPNGEIMHSTHQADLDIPNLPSPARTAHIFPHLASGSLLSIGKLCDAGCTALFNKSKLFIFYKGKIIMQGSRQSNKLWTMDSKNNNQQQQQTRHSLNALIDTPTIAERIKFYHQSLWSPTLDTLSKAIKQGFLLTFPQFNMQQIKKYVPPTETTAKGHMRAIPSNYRSTKKLFNSQFQVFNATTVPQSQHHLIEDNNTIISQTPSVSTPATPSSSDIIERTHFVYAACEPITGQIYTDQTGKFSHESITGNKYVMVLYDLDSNYIAAEPMPSKTKFQHLCAYQKLKKRFERRGLKPQLQRLDNEASDLLKDEMDKSDITYQLTPARNHKRNTAERAIQVFKNHFISGFCSVDPKFPLKLWDKLLPQAEITLNLLRPSRVNPNLSAYAQVYGQFDFTKTPIAPPGLQLMTHIDPQQRTSWGTHAEKGFYLGPAMNHYRCHRIWITKTQAERIAETVKWLPHAGIKMPIPSQGALIQAAIEDLTNAIKSPNINNIVSPDNTKLYKSLIELQQIFSVPSPQPRVPPEIITPIHDSQPRVPPGIITPIHDSQPKEKVSDHQPSPMTKVIPSQPAPQPRVPPSQPVPHPEPVPQTEVLHQTPKVSPKVYPKNVQHKPTTPTSSTTHASSDTRNFSEEKPSHPTYFNHQHEITPQTPKTNSLVFTRISQPHHQHTLLQCCSQQRYWSHGRIQRPFERHRSRNMVGCFLQRNGKTSKRQTKRRRHRNQHS